MSTEVASNELGLTARGTLALRDADGVRVEIRRGRVWITTQGRPADIWLEGPARHVVEGDGLTVIEATTDAVIGIAPPAAIRDRSERMAACAA